MFIGRSDELAELEKLSRQNRAALVVMRGRRRIGKSTLIQRFGQKVPRYVEFQGLAPRADISASDQLENFSKQISDQFGLPKFKFDSWHDAFTLLANQTEKGKTVILLDEVSWMASRSKDFAGELKIAWDTKFKRNNKLTLVLCGSVSSWIEQNILKSAGFMGRVSLTITLEELPLPLCSEFWGSRKSRVSAYEKFRLLAVTGGVPRYLEEIDPSDTAESNIKRMCFTRSGVLFNEFGQIFQDTFGRRADAYRGLVQTLVDHRRSFSEIAQQIEVDPNGVVSEYLSELEDSGFITRDYVYSTRSGKRGRLSRYRLRDNYVRFYLKYVEPVRDRVLNGLYRQRSLETLPGLDSIMGFQLENLVLNNLPHVLEKLDVPLESVISASPYFQNQTTRQEACQIDLLIQTRGTLYVCEIKFRGKITASVIGEVNEKVRKLKYPPRTSIRPALIYVGELADAVEQDRYFDRLIPLDELLR